MQGSYSVSNGRVVCQNFGLHDLDGQGKFRSNQTDYTFYFIDGILKGYKEGWNNSLNRNCNIFAKDQGL